MADPKLPPRPVDFVKKVGRGKSLSQDLAFEESRLAFASLLDGDFSPVQVGAFLQALRIKELTQDELDGLMAVFSGRMRRGEMPPPLPGPSSLALNLASDTARKGGLVSLLAARLLPGLGVNVGVIRSEPALSKNRRSFEETWSLADGLGCPGVPVADCGDLIPGLKPLDGLRGDLGFRSCLHTAEKLVNPWPASPLLLGISHKHYAFRMAEALRNLGLTGCIALGNHGTTDLVLHKETELVSVRGGEIREESVSPETLGLRPAPDVYSLGRLPEWGAWLAGPLGPDGLPDNGLWQALLYQLAVMAWTAGAAADPAEGLALARRGMARRV